MKEISLTLFVATMYSYIYDDVGTVTIQSSCFVIDNGDLATRHLKPEWHEQPNMLD